MNTLKTNIMKKVRVTKTLIHHVGYHFSMLTLFSLTLFTLLSGCGADNSPTNTTETVQGGKAGPVSADNSSANTTETAQGGEAGPVAADNSPTNTTETAQGGEAGPVAVQPPPAPGTLPGVFLLAFHACDTQSTNCFNPQNHSTYLAHSDDGASWTPLPNFTTFSGSVPDLIRRGDKVYVYNPGRVRRYTISTQTMDTGVAVSMRTRTGAIEHFVDPAPYLDPSTNKIILFYLSSTGVIGDPAQCTTCPMRSATEVEGSDGTQFVVDSGDRILVARGTDPDIFFDGTRYIMYISEGASVRVATSPVLQGSYTLVSTLPGGLLTNTGGVPAGHYDPATAQYWTYLHTPDNPSVIKRAIHPDFSRTLTESDFLTVVAGATFTGLGASYVVQSPGFTVNQ